MPSPLFVFLGLVDISSALILFITRDASPLPFLNVILAVILFLKGVASLF